MPTSYTRTGNISALIGNANVLRVFVRPRIPDGELLVDHTGKEILAGAGIIPVSPNGDISATLPGTDSTDLNVAANTWAYELVIVYIDATSQEKRTFSRPFQLTSSGSFADKNFLGDLSPLAVQSSSQFATEAKAARDATLAAAAGVDAALEGALGEVRDISGISTSDDLVEAMVKGTAGAGPKTRAALSATIAAGITPVSEVASKSSRAVGSGYGFDVATTDPGHFFLAYHPSGDMIAVDALSTGGRGLARSSDNGKTWTSLPQVSSANVATSLWFSTAGTWFALVTGGQGLWRSADEGATWTQVNANAGAVLDEGFTQDASGTLYTARYIGPGSIYQSTDDGVTWTLHSYIPTTDAGDANPVVRHLHGIRALPSGLWCVTGDSGTEAGFFRWQGGAWVRKSPAWTDPQGGQTWRAVGLTERNGYLYWAQDGASANGVEPPGMFKALATDLGGTVKRLATLPTGGWYTAKLSGGEILVGGVIEEVGKEADKSLRLWLIDKDDQVHDIFSTFRTDGAAVDFTAVRNLYVRPSDQRVAFRVNQTDWTGAGSSKQATVTGFVRRGIKPAAMTRGTTRDAYSDTARVWKANVTTSGPTTNSTTAVAVPEMTLRVPASGRPLQIFAQVIGHMSVNTQTLTVRIYKDGNAWSLPVTLRPNPDYATFTIMDVDTPTAGDHTYEVRWFVSGTALADSNFLNRRFIITEL